MFPFKAIDQKQKYYANDTDDTNVDRDIPYVSVMICRRYNKGLIAHANNQVSIKQSWYARNTILA